MSRKIILEAVKLSAHVQEYMTNKDSYLTNVKEIFDNPDCYRKMSSESKAFVVTVLLQFREKETFASLKLDVPEVLEACLFLDSTRHKKQLERQLEVENVSEQKKRKYQAKLSQVLLKHTQVVECNVPFSLSLSKIKMIKKWTRSISRNDLLFKVLFFDNNLWRSLADYCHFAPNDFVVDWFVSYCFTNVIPAHDPIAPIKAGDVSHIERIYDEIPLSYEFLRLHRTKYTSQFFTRIARKENLRTLLWYLHEFETPEIRNIIAERLQNENIINTLSYGQITMMLMNSRVEDSLYNMLITASETKLRTYRINLPSPIAILCDASGSMQVAVKTSSIISSLLCAMCEAELHIFKNQNQIANPPRTVKESIVFSKQMNADGGTCPASSMNHFLTTKKEVRTFFVVTDQEENGVCQGMNFATTFQKYYNTVSKARLIFITFGKSMQMIRQLESTLGQGICSDIVKNYVFDFNDPDLRKLDIVLNSIAVSE